MSDRERPSLLRLNPADNVAVAMRRIKAGEVLESGRVVAAAGVPSGHKIAIEGISAGDLVRKYGQVIGLATENIAPGSHVHIHNLAMSNLRATPPSLRCQVRQEPPRTFDGYRRV